MDCLAQHLRRELLCPSATLYSSVVQASTTMMAGSRCQTSSTEKFGLHWTVSWIRRIFVYTKCSLIYLISPFLWNRRISNVIHSPQEFKQILVVCGRRDLWYWLYNLFCFVRKNIIWRSSLLLALHSVWTPLLFSSNYTSSVANNCYCTALKTGLLSSSPSMQGDI